MSIARAPRDGLDADVMAAIGRSRDRALHFLADFSGVEFEEIGNGHSRVGLPPRPQNMTESGAYAPAAVAMACDIGLAAAARSAIGVGAGLATVALVLDYTTYPIRGERLVLCAALRDRVGGIVHVTGSLETSAGAVGRATGQFLVQERPPDAAHAHLPWDRRSAHLPDPDSLTPHERRIRDFLQYAGATAAAAGGVHRRLYRIAVRSAADGRASLQQQVGPHLANRSGRVQGGVVAGLLEQACRDAAESADPALSLLTSRCTFLRPGRIESTTLVAEASIAFAGRRIACVAGEVSDDTGRCLARGEALLQS